MRLGGVLVGVSVEDRGGAVAIKAFMGNAHPRLDDKGRVILPAKFRDRLSDGLVMVKGQEHCIYVWPREAFETQLADVQSRSITSAADRAYSRVLLASAYEDAADKQGRVTLPPDLRAWAGLSGDLTVVGQFDHVEIWDFAAWAAYESVHEEGYAQLDEKGVGPTASPAT